MVLDAKTESIISKASSLGITDETKVRDLRIRCAFKSMRSNGMKYEDALFKCSMQFCLSEARIKTITHGIKSNGKKKRINKAA